MVKLSELLRSFSNKINLAKLSSKFHSISMTSITVDFFLIKLKWKRGGVKLTKYFPYHPGSDLFNVSYHTFAEGIILSVVI